MIRDLIRWTWAKDYRTWIAHGLLTFGLTAFGGMLTIPEIGAAAALGYYVIDTLTEILVHGWPAEMRKRVDHAMDVLFPILAVAIYAGL